MSMELTHCHCWMVSCGYINIKVTHFQSRRHYCCNTVVLRIFPYCQNTDDLVFCRVEDDVKKKKKNCWLLLLFLLNAGLFAEENLLHCLAKHRMRAQVRWGLFKMTSYWQTHLNDSSLKGLIPFLKKSFWRSWGRTAFSKLGILCPGGSLLENNCLPC